MPSRGGGAWSGGCGIPACTEAETPPGQTHRCKNITFATSLQMVKIQLVVIVAIPVRTDLSLFMGSQFILFYHLPKELRECNVFIRVCLSWGTRVTITHDALDPTIQPLPPALALPCCRHQTWDPPPGHH